MSEPNPPVAPQGVPKDGATGEWSSVTERASPPADSPTVTSSGQTATPGDYGIPNPFGRYSIERLLGRGGMGAVFLAHDTQLDRPVALKIPTFQGRLSVDQKERFFREARAIAALRHPNICPVYDVDDEHGTLYLTMHYIDGQTLAARLKEGPLDHNAGAQLIRRVALAMQAAHEHGTIHRDIKPANIMIDRAGEPVVMDFGLARKGEMADEETNDLPAPATRDAGLTQMGSVLGTPAYMPPEQAVGDLNAIGPCSDIYALGAVFYECLTGKRPFDGPDTASIIEKILRAPPTRPRDLVGTIDPGLEKVCLKAMAKSPAQRYESMADFAAAIKAVVEPELKVVVPPPLPLLSRQTPVKKRRWLTPMSCLGITLAFTIVCVGGPTLAVWLLINRVSDMVKELQQASERSNYEWETLVNFWQPPAETGDDAMFPPVVEGYRRTRNDTEVADNDLGLTLPGRRAIYTGPGGEEIEVRAYPCTSAEAKARQAKAEDFVRSIQGSGISVSGDSKRKKVIYTASNSAQRTLTFGFSDSFNRNQEYGKIWYGQGWLFYFKTTAPMIIEYFPSKYLLEVGKRVVAPPKAKK